MDVEVIRSARGWEWCEEYEMASNAVMLDGWTCLFFMGLGGGGGGCVVGW